MTTELDVDSDQAGTAEVSEADEKILLQARADFRLCKDYYDEMYRQGKEDVDFLQSDGWPEEIRRDRELEGKPCLNIPRLLPFVHQVENEIRQSRPAIKVSPVDDKADKETARVLKGGIRNIETVSGADNVYDTASSNAIRASIGWIRVQTKYCDEKSFDQEIEILDVFNPFSVYIDPNIKKKDGSDAEFGFVFDPVPRKEFAERWPKANPVDFEQYGETGLCDADHIMVCEYFKREYVDAEIYNTPKGGLTAEEAKAAGIDVSAYPADRKRKTRLPQMKWYLITANEILERTDWPGKYVPLVPVYGDLVLHDGKRIARSLIYHAKDAQRLLNYWKSANAEMIALQPRAPYVGAVGSFKTMRNNWLMANSSNLPFLEYDPVFVIDPVTKQSSLAPAPSRAQPPTASMAMFQETIAADNDIKAALGMFAPSLGADSDEKSGKAILARQQQGNNATFHFMDNLATAIRHVGRIIVDLFPNVYTGQRIIRILGDDDNEQTVPLRTELTPDTMPAGFKPKMGHNGGPPMFDPDMGKYDVTVAVGPAYQTKRLESVNTIVELIRANPAIAPLVSDILFKNLDFAEADILAERLKAQLPPALQADDPNAAKLMEMGQGMEALKAQLQQAMQLLEDKTGREDREFALKERELGIKEKQADADIAAKQAQATNTQADTALTLEQVLPALIEAIEEIQANVMDTGQAVAMMIDADGEGPAPDNDNEIPPAGDEGTPAPLQAGA